MIITSQRSSSQVRVAPIGIALPCHRLTRGIGSEEGGRYRAPISKYGEMLAAVIGLFFFSNYYNPL
jgi:hypothetical protein